MPILEEWLIHRRVSIHKDLIKLGEQASRNLVMFNRGICEVVHRDQKFPVGWVRLRAEQRALQLDFGACRTTATDNLETPEKGC